MEPTNVVAANIVWGIVASGISILLTYFVARRKSKGDAISTELANVEKAISIYRGIAEDLQREIHELKTELEKVYQQNKTIQLENRDLKKQLSHLEQKLNELSK